MEPLELEKNTLTIWQKIKGFIVLVSGLGAFISLYWEPIWKVLYASAVISIGEWGDNNWYEQITEAVNKWVTGVEVDISKEVATETAEPRNLKKYIPNER